MKLKMKRIRKADFIDFVNALIKDGSKRVIGVKSKSGKFIFDELVSADELRLDYDVTVLPPKKYFMPQNETLLSFEFSDESSVRPINEVEPLIIIGVHPYDIIALEQLDRVFRDANPDTNYIRKRDEAIIIGANILNVSPYGFAGSMGTYTAEHGFDLMLTDVGDAYAVELGTEKGRKILDKYAKTSDCDEATVKEVERIKSGVASKFRKALNFPISELPKILADNYGSDLWNKESEKCLKCGSCNLVCPTCYCFDVRDLVALDMKTGERVRTWDGCLLEDFAKVATGENFRKDKASRYRHRFMRKGRYLFDRYGFIACVGCGRCASACLPDIADPVRILNTLKEGCN